MTGDQLAPTDDSNAPRNNPYFFFYAFYILLIRNEIYEREGEKERGRKIIETKEVIYKAQEKIRL